MHFLVLTIWFPTRCCWAPTHIAQSYLDEAEAARSGAGMQDVISERSLPWLDPAVARRIASGASVPNFLVAAAGRGFCSVGLPEPVWSQLRGLRCAATATLLGGRAPGSAYEHDANSEALFLLAPAAQGALAGASRAQLAGWFTPEKCLPGMPVRGAPTPPAAEVEAAGSVAETAARIAAAAPDLPPLLAIFYALLLHAVEVAEGAWDPAAVRELLLPGEPMPPAVDAVPPPVEGAEADDDEAGLQQLLQVRGGGSRPATAQCLERHAVGGVRQRKGKGGWAWQREASQHAHGARLVCDCCSSYIYAC